MTTQSPDRLGWAQVLTDLAAGHPLSPLQAEWAMSEVMTGEATPGQIGAFLMGLRSRAVLPEEIATFVSIMLQHAHPVAGGEQAVDTCGTGGDGAQTVNISTMAAVVVAATGQPVVKHGNRAASSQSGSADVLQALGIPLDLAPDAVESCLAEAGITFCFAPVFHPAMRFAGPVRRELGIPTVFNVLGPLANPARPRAQIVGVADPALAPVVAEALRLRGTSALVVRGDDGLDEITTSGPTAVWDATGDEVTAELIDAADLGVTRPAEGALRGGDAAFNAGVAEAVFAGSPDVSAVIDAVCVNAAGALVAAGVVSGGSLTDRLGAGYERARRAVSDGSAQATMQRWRRVAGSLA